MCRKGIKELSSLEWCSGDVDGLLQLSLSLMSVTVLDLEKGQGMLRNMSYVLYHLVGQKLNWVGLSWVTWKAVVVVCPSYSLVIRSKGCTNWVMDIHFLFEVRECICTNLTILVVPQCKLFKAPPKRPLQKTEFIFPCSFLCQYKILFQHTVHRTCETSPMPTHLYAVYTHMLFNILLIFLNAAKESFTNTDLIFTCGSV